MSIVWILFECAFFAFAIIRVCILQYGSQPRVCVLQKGLFVCPLCPPTSTVIRTVFAALCVFMRSFYVTLLLFASAVIFVHRPHSHKVLFVHHRLSQNLDNPLLRSKSMSECLTVGSKGARLWRARRFHAGRHLPHRNPYRASSAPSWPPSIRSAHPLPMNPMALSSSSPSRSPHPWRENECGRVYPYGILARIVGISMNRSQL